MSKVGKIIASWDVGEIVESQVKCLIEDEYSEQISNGEKTEDSIREEVYTDTVLFELLLNDLTDHLTNVLNAKNENGYWKTKVRNFGWRNSNGEKVISASNGQELLEKILPRTECTFKIFNYGRGIAIQNYHHDSPTGNEWYFITPIKESTYEKLR